LDLEDIKVEDLLDEKRKDADSGISRAFFLTSTYGEGEPTDNTVDFVTRLKEMTNLEIIGASEEKKEDMDPDSADDLDMSGLHYGVFGLGNTEYEHYNAIGKFFDHAFERTGSTRVVELGLGDDGQDLEGDFESWKENKFWPTLKRLYISDSTVLDRLEHAAPKEELLSTPYAIEYHPEPQKPSKIPLEKVHGSSRHYFTAEDCSIQVVRELRSEEDPGSTVHVEIDVSNAKEINYETADNLGVLPVNQVVVVESVARSLGFDLDQIFTVRAADGHEWHGAPFPMPLSIRECLSRYCDLTSAPRRSDLKLLASYAKDPVDKKALLRLASKEGKTEYKEKITDAHFGLVDVLRMCPSIEAPMEHFLNFVPLLQTRFYTISSSSSVHPKSVHLTVSLTEAKRNDGSIFKGVCSDYIASLKSGDLIRVFSRSSTFRLPKDSSKPILMVGPGTGIAPFRGLLQERSYQKMTQKKTVGDNVLYFGCKKRSMDFLYQDELNAFQKSGILTKLHLAFSREQNEKIYVQHLLLRNSKETWKLIEQDGSCVYVCGGVKMGNDVMDTLKQIVSQEGGMSLDAAKGFLNKLSAEGRYVQELWA